MFYACQKHEKITSSFCIIFLNFGLICAVNFQVCQHEGTCELEENSLGGYTCDCLEDFRGRNCEIHSLCENSGGCQNGATCRVEKAEVLCDCAYGYVGKFCETGIAFLIQNGPAIG